MSRIEVSVLLGLFRLKESALIRNCNLQIARPLSIIALAVSLTLQSLPLAFAQSARASVEGRVLDQSGAIVTGITVVLRQQSGLEHAVVTDGNGSFNFKDLPPGEYTLSVSGLGFSAFAETLTLAGQNRNMEITLKPGAVAEKITVTATRSETVIDNTPVPVSVVEREELERKTLTTVGDIFRQLPGVSTANEGPFQVRPRIRGLDSNRVLILVDGERLNNSRTSTSNSGIEIGLVDIDQIESIEIARGSGSVLYGTDALAGTINIITRSTLPRQESGFRLAGGFNGFLSSNDVGRRGSAYLTGAGSLFAFRVAHSQDRFDNYHSGAVPTAAGKDDSDEATEVLNSQYHGSNTQLLGRLFLNDLNSVRVNYERRRASNIGVPATVGVFTAFFPFSNRDKVSARYDGYNFTSYLTRLSASVYYQSQERNFSNILDVPAAPPFFPGQFQFSETVTDTDSAGFDLQSNWALGARNVLTAGASYFRDHNTDERFIERLSPDFSTFPPSLVRSEDRSKSVPNSKFGDFALFAQDEYQPLRWLRLVGGIRFDRFDINSDRTPGFDLPAFFTPEQIADLNLIGLDEGLSVNDTAVSGDFGAVISPTSHLSFTARIGRSFREPNLFERFFTDFGSAAGFVVGNPTLEPEKGINFDTSVRFRSSRLAGSFTYFHNRYEDFLTSAVAVDRNGVPITIPAGTSPVPVFQTINTSRARIQGIEAEFEAPFRIPRGFLTPFGNVSYLRGDDIDADEPLDFITPLKTVAGLRWHEERDRFWAEYTVRVVNTQDRLTPDFLVSNGGAEAGFAAHDLRGGVSVRRERYAMNFTIGVENLANRFYNEQFVFAPARGRSAVFGVGLKFF